MKQTAVDWFFDNLKNHEVQAEHLALYEKAKKMEKEQIMDAYEAGSHTVWSEDTWMLVEKQEYYNETFNTNKK